MKSSTQVCLVAILLFGNIVGAEDSDPAEIVNGERLFLETRFAEFFYQHLQNGGKVNSELPQGDPALNSTVKFQGQHAEQASMLDGPFAGQSMNCRSCHLVDEHLDDAKFGMRSYSDFARRSILPAREDGKTLTVRNSPPLVGVSVEREHFMLHFDGEFSSMMELVLNTLTGRNLGWLPEEKHKAMHHICRVIKHDNGTDSLAEEFGNLSYKEMLSGVTNEEKSVEDEFLLPVEYRLDVAEANCSQIVEGVAKLIAIYTDDLMFGQDSEGAFELSPYDQFLIVNNLPRQPSENANDFEYSQNLLNAISELEKNNKIKFIHHDPSTKEESFQFHNQRFVFAESELAGLKVFFSIGENNSGGNGNCVACHVPPNFSDFSLHNTGVTQHEYDRVHGLGAFSKLMIPTLSERNAHPEKYLPATLQHPANAEVFRSIPSKDNHQLTDLGAWNILANEDYPYAQTSLVNALCQSSLNCKFDDELLAKSIATFKTPSVRDLGHSSPFMHNGQFNDLEQVVDFYLQISVLAKNGMLRNADIEILKMNLSEKDISPLAAFMRSLNEDYN